MTKKASVFLSGLVSLLLLFSCQKDTDLATPGVNHPPELLSPAFVETYVDSVFSYRIEVSDPDGDPITLSVLEKPDWLTYAENMQELSGIPTREDVGEQIVELRFSDEQYAVRKQLRMNVVDLYTFQPELQAILEEAYADHTPGLAGVSLAIVQPDGLLFSAQVGSSHFEEDLPLEEYHQYRIASISKTFTAALIIRMAEEDLLNLDDRLIHHLSIPELEYGNFITIRQLLNHTSGVFDHLNSTDFWLDPYNTPTKVWTNEEIFQYAVDAGAYFFPGTSYAYSNTGYYILGAVAEEILQQPLGEIFREWIFEPLGLENTFYDDFSSEDYPIPNLAVSERAYDYHLSAAGAAGAIVSTPSDVAKFGKALYGGSFISSGHVGQMLINYGGEYGADYGLGTRIWYDHGIYHYGHTGSLMEYRSILMYVHEKGLAIAIHTNAYHSKWFNLVNEVLVELEERF